MTNNPTIDGVSREWITVPVDPTEEMRLAFGKQMRDGNYNEGTLAGDMCLGIWQAMVAAAPAVERKETAAPFYVTPNGKMYAKANELFESPIVQRQLSAFSLLANESKGASPTPEVAALQSTIARLEARIAELESGDNHV